MADPPLKLVRPMFEAEISRLVTTAFTSYMDWMPGLANRETPIEEEHLSSICGMVSEKMGREIILVGQAPAGGWKFSIGTLVQYIYENQGKFYPPNFREPKP